jgi:uncharacterized membrane protein
MNEVLKEMKLKEQRNVRRVCFIGILLGLLLAPIGVGIIIAIISIIGVIMANGTIREIQAK